MYMLMDLKKIRKSLHLTQFELAALAGVSLPTIQNIEAQKANPSVALLARLGDVLHFELSFVQAEPDWATLAQLGLPIEVESNLPFREPTLEVLSEVFPRACSYLKLTPREQVACGALAFALQRHFPKECAHILDHFAVKRFLNEKFLKENWGKILKLRRIATNRICRYL
jgi:transcriptional regulator with XRE-family HTH domain